MSGVEAVFGVVAGGAGFLSLALQLAEKAEMLKSFYQSVKNAPATLKKLASTCETISLILQELEQQREEDATDVTLLMRCLDACGRDATNIQETIDKIERFLTRFSKIGRVYTALKETELEKLLNEVEHSKSSLHLALDLYYARRQNARHNQIEATMANLSLQLASISQASPATSKPLLCLPGTLEKDLGHKEQLDISKSGGPGTLVKYNSNTRQAGSRDAPRQSRRKNDKPYFRIQLYWSRLASSVWDLAAYHATNGWDTRVRTYNYRPISSEVFERCRHGDIAGVQQLVARGQASLLDCFWTYKKNTLLDIAVVCGHIDLCKYLLDEATWVDHSTVVSAVLDVAATLPSSSAAEAFYRLAIEDHGADVDIDLNGPGKRCWRLCPSPTCLELIIRHQTLPLSTLSVQVRLCLMMRKVLDESCNMRPADLLRYIGLQLENPELISWRNENGWTILFHVAICMSSRRNIVGTTLQEWAGFGTQLLKAGLDPNHVSAIGCGPIIWRDTALLGYMRLMLLRMWRSMDELLERLRLWAKMIHDAGADMFTYGKREDALLKKLIGQREEVEREQSMESCRDGADLMGIVYSNDPSVWSFKVYRFKKIDTYRLHHLPGAFRQEQRLPEEIAWRPSKREREEGQWQHVRTIKLRSATFDAQKWTPWMQNPFMALVEKAQDDTGVLMLMIGRTCRAQSTKQRSHSSPPSLRREKMANHDWGHSLSHPWLPQYHLCVHESRYRYGCHDVRRCAQGAYREGNPLHNSRYWRVYSFVASRRILEGNSSFPT